MLDVSTVARRNRRELQPNQCMNERHPEKRLRPKAVRRRNYQKSSLDRGTYEYQDRWFDQPSAV